MAKPKAIKKYTKVRPKYKKGRQMMIYKTPFKESFPCKIRYATQIGITSTSGAIGLHRFRANSIYDSDRTGVGSQGRFVDSLLGIQGSTAPYRKYRVVSSKIGCRYISQQAAYGSGVLNVVLGCAEANKTLPLTAVEARERNDCHVVILGSGYSGNGVKYMSRKCSIKKALQIKDLKDNPDTAAAYNANPVSEVDFFVMMEPVDGASTTTVTVEVTIEYNVIFFDLNDVADS